MQHARNLPDSARNPWIDNARFVLIVLVVFGHSLEPLLGSGHPTVEAAYRFIYLFHMPAFAALSGAVASTGLDASTLRKIVFRLLLPYLVFQGLYTLAAMSSNWPDDGPGGIATPYWLLWYLPSLACWRLMLPFFARLRFRIVLAVSLALAAGWAGDLGYYLSLSRILVFFPFFLLGWRFVPAWREQSRMLPVRVGAIITLLALLALSFTSHPDPHWLYGSYGYSDLDVSALVGVGLRALQLAGACLAGLAVLALIPRRHTHISALGQGSLSAYLLHGFVIKFAIGFGLFGVLAPLPPALSLTLLAAAALVLAAILATPPVHRLIASASSPAWLRRALWHPQRETTA